MKHGFRGIQISAVSAAVPKTQLDYSSLTGQWSQDEIQRIVRSTGFRSCRIADDATTASDLCFAAAEQLLAEVDVKRDEIDAILFVSQTPDYAMPATSVLLQSRLKLSTAALALDFNYGCSGYIYGLFQAFLLVQSGVARNVLVCAGETTAKLISPKDKAVRFLFGDAGSCTLVTSGQETASCSLYSDGSRHHALIVPAGGFRRRTSEESRTLKQYEEGSFRSDEHLHMDGLKVFQFVLSEVPPVVSHVLEGQGWLKSDVSFYAFHQANELIVKTLRMKMGTDEKTAPFLLGEFGNSGPATIPVLLTQAAERNLSKVVMSGFGTGLSWGAVATSLQSTKILPLLEVNSVNASVA